MTKPRRFLNEPAIAAQIVACFRAANKAPETSYATVRDYCESLDRLPQITGLDGVIAVEQTQCIKELVSYSMDTTPLLQ